MTKIWPSYFLMFFWLFGTFTPAPAIELPAETHPCLLYNDETIPIILERISIAPYATWWNQVIAVADQGLTINFADENEEYRKAYFAKHLAFAYGLTQFEAYGLKTEENFLQMGAGNWGDSQNEGKAASMYIEAYDILAGSNYFVLYPENQDQIRNILKDEADRVEFLLQ